MALTPIKLLLFLAGGSAAAGGTAYVAGVFDPYFNPPVLADTPPVDAPKVAALPSAEAPAVEKPAAAAAPDKPAAPASDAAAKPAAGEPEAPAAAPKPQETKPDAVAALEPPAVPDAAAPAPSLVIPAFDLIRVQADGSIVIAGTAAPEARVEAVIGSRVIGSAVAGPGGDFAIVLDEPLKPGDYQIVLRSTTPANVVATSEETAVVSIPDTAAGQVLALVEAPGKPAELITKPEPKPGSSEAPAEAREPAVAAAPQQPAGTEADAPARPSAGPEQPAAGAEATTVPEKPAAQGEQQTAAAGQEPSATGQPAAEQPRVNVEAVEIEGRRIFVAGSAEAGRMVRAYANEILLGEATTSAAGRFLVEAERDLPVGDYIVRVDMLGPDGAKVLARAAVPFQREAGENIAAVAPAATGADADGAAADTKQPRVTAAPEASAQPAPDKSSDGSSSQPAPAEAAATPQPSAGAEDKPADVAAASPAAPKPSNSIEPAPIAPAAPVVEEAPGGEATQKQDAAPAETDTAAAPAETLAPKLQSVDRSVIIRRGDSLWRISRRVYGRGVRYSTIYLANQEQIRDPHKIWPGQVFRVPDKTGEGEQADMTQLGEQAVAPTARQ